MAIFKTPFLACPNRFKRHKQGRSEKHEEKRLVSQFVEGRRASLLTQREDLEDLIATCTSWDTSIRDLPSIPKRTDLCWMFCSNLLSEARGLRIELLKLQQDLGALDLPGNETGILEEVFRAVHQRLVEMPSFDAVRADTLLLARSRIRLWHRSRVRKHALTFETAAQHFQAARGRVQNFRTCLAVDHRQELDLRTERVLDDANMLGRSSCIIRPAKMTRDSERRKRPWLLHRFSTSSSNVSRSTLVAAPLLK